MLASCGYPSADDLFNQNLVITRYAPNADFGGFKTFAVDPTLHVAMLESDGGITPQMQDEANSAPIIAHVVSALEQRGYQQVQADQQPDLGVTLAAITSLSTQSVSGNLAFGNYSAYWGFPSYGYYAPYVTSFTYRRGALIVDLVDLAAARSGADAGTATPVPRSQGGMAASLEVVWVMVGYQALADSDPSARVDDANRAIDQAFAQSPNLRSMQ